ncbi:MAG: hypothetical protein ACREQY_18250 [Candidatus Binatia bacterium]
MVGEFLVGLIVGVLLGLALAPLLRAWMLWQMASAWRDRSTRERPKRRAPVGGSER